IFVAQFIGRVNLVPSRVSRTTGDTGDVELWGRPVAAKPAAPLQPGGAVSLAFRPESVSLSAETAPAPASEIGVIGVVRGRTFLGEKVEYVIEIAGGTIEGVAWDPLRHGVWD